MHYFALLTRDEQAEAIIRMAAQRMSESTISAATQLSIEQIRQVLGQRRALEEQAL